MALNLRRTRVKAKISAPKTVFNDVSDDPKNPENMESDVLAALKIKAAIKLSVEAPVASFRMSVDL